MVVPCHKNASITHSSLLLAISLFHLQHSIPVLCNLLLSEASSQTDIRDESDTTASVMIQFAALKLFCF